MLNMTALKIRLNTGKYESVKFVAGASTVVFIQAGIALFFAEFFVNNPAVIKNLKIAGIVVFFILSAVFFLQARKKVNSKNTTKGNYYLRGVFMSSINLLAIPFYLGVSVLLASEDKIIIAQPYIVFFVFGASLGSFLLFYTYIAFASYIEKRISFITQNINYILGSLFFILGLVTFYKTLF